MRQPTARLSSWLDKIWGQRHELEARLAETTTKLDRFNKDCADFVHTALVEFATELKVFSGLSAPERSSHLQRCRGTFDRRLEEIKERVRVLVRRGQIPAEGLELMFVGDPYDAMKHPLAAASLAVEKDSEICDQQISRANKALEEFSERVHHYMSIAERNILGGISARAA